MAEDMATTAPPPPPPAAPREAAENLDSPPPPPPPPAEYPFLVRAIGKRRTWISLFLLAYALLISFSGNLLLSIRSWYDSAAGDGTGGGVWPAIYASILYGGVFGLLAVAAALAVAVPAALVTWATVLVLLTCAGKPRERLVMVGREITADIAAFAARVLAREGILVAVSCAAASFFALFWRRGALEVEDDL